MRWLGIGVFAHVHFRPLDPHISFMDAKSTRVKIDASKADASIENLTHMSAKRSETFSARIREVCIVKKIAKEIKLKFKLQRENNAYHFRGDDSSFHQRRFFEGRLTVRVVSCRKDQRSRVYHPRSVLGHVNFTYRL